ncbi:hypothetical protein [Fusobacterium sp. MFO224]|uniref:hypothetical protein n=1 Tax=Fusobacterium sp. MFO224 TaxID=3378070 RepID=UPI0038540930
MLKKTKAFILIEYTVYLFIILTIFSFSILKIKKVNENLKKKEAIIKIVNIVDKYCNKSFKRKKYKFIFETENKNIKVYDLFGKEPIDQINLPSILDYKIPYNGNYINKFVFDSTTNSNLTKSFSIYIFNNKKAEYRISFYLFRVNKILKINVYKSLLSQAMDKKEILENYNDDEFVKERWIKINDY